MLVTFKEAAAATAPRHRGLLYRPLLSLWKMSRRNWYISHCALYLCAMFQLLWSGFTLTFPSALFSLAFFLGLSENSSIGFQWGVFHLRQSSLPFPTRSPFDSGYLFWDPTFQHVVWSEIYPGCFVRWGLKSGPAPQRWGRRCADAAVLGRSAALNVVLALQTRLKSD